MSSTLMVAPLHCLAEGPDQAVNCLSFRKPSGRAVLQASMKLARLAGPLLVFDDDLDTAFVVSPQDDPAALAEHWPW